MSTTTQTPGAPGTMKQTERIQAPMGGPGRGPMGGAFGSFEESAVPKGDVTFTSGNSGSWRAAINSMS